MDEAAAFLSTVLSAAELADAVYVRFVGIADGGKSSWSASYYLPDVPVLAEVLPNVAVGSIAPGGNDVTLTAYVFDAGSLSGDGLVDVALEYALDPDAFADGSLAKVWSVPFTNGVAVGAVDAVRVGDLRPGRRYFARFVGVNDAQQSGAGDVFSFETAAAAAVPPKAVYGLLQERRSVSGGGNVSSVESLAFDESNAVLVEGAIMAYRNGSAKWDSVLAGASFNWGDNVGWLYKGWMFLEGGKTYTFGSSIDDSCIVWIGGEQVLRQADYNSRNNYGTYAPAATAWYPIELRMSNGTGGSGACNDNGTFGFGFNTDGTKNVTASKMTRLVDPGDGSLLRPDATRRIALVSAERAAGGVFATVRVSGGNPLGTLRAFWGASDGGTNAAAWASPSDLGSVGGGEATVTATLPVADPGATPFVRFAVVGSGGEAVWSDLVWLDVSQPVIGDVFATTDGDRMTVSGAALSLGSGEGYSLALLWGYDRGLSDAQSAAVAVADGAFSATVPVLPGTNGWYRLVATTSDGGYDATLPIEFATKAGSVLAATATSTMNHHDVTVSGNLDVLGAGVTTVTLWAGEDPEHMTAVGGASASAILDGTGPFSLTGTIPGQVPHSFSWKIVSVNVAPGGTAWTNETSVFTATTVDAATYTWKPEKTEGRWDDPENWTVSGVPDLTDVLGYPNSKNAPAKFLDGTTAVVIVPDGTWYFQSLDLNVNHLDVHFVGGGAGSSQLYGNVWGGGNDSKWSGWTVVFDALTLREENTIQLGNAKSENVRLVFENGAVGSFSGWQDLQGTNTWIVARGGSRLEWRNGDGITVRGWNAGLELDESTATVPQFCYERQSAAGPQGLLISGENARFQATTIFRTYSESEDPMNRDFDIEFLVPLQGWKAGVDAPVYASYDKGTDNKKLFAWRSTELAHKVRLSVDQDSPLVQSGRTLTVQLVEWKAGIDTKNVELVQGVAGGKPTGQTFAKLYYTYGWPSTRAAPDGNEIPTGVAARVTGLGGTIMILRSSPPRRPWRGAARPHPATGAWSRPYGPRSRGLDPLRLASLKRGSRATPIDP